MPPVLSRAWIRDYLDALTEQWLGWTFPPVRRAVENAGWKCDERSEYCGRCGDSVGPGEATETGCATCREGAELSGGVGDGVVRLGAHVESLRDWVVKIKYERWAEMGDWLGQLLGRRVLEAGVIELERAVIVPMPMPWQRRMYRGIDHSRVIASGVARVLEAPIAMVLKKANRAPQVTLAPSERRRSGSRGLRIRRRLGGWPLDGLDVVLVDDVRTTGATLRAAMRLIKTMKPRRVIGAVLAVSDSKARRDRGQLPRQYIEAQDSADEPELAKHI